MSKVCPNCKKLCDDEDKFCSNCGKCLYRSEQYLGDLLDEINREWKEKREKGEPEENVDTMP